MDYILNDGELPPLPEKKVVGRPKGSFRKKFNVAEQRAFINESIQEVFNNHLSHREYVTWCSKTAQVSHSQCNQYWHQLWVGVQRKFEQSKDKLILKHIASYWNIHSLAIQNGDLSNARQTLNDLAKLLGLNEAEKVQVEHQVIKLNFGTPENNETKLIEDED
jgi:hypothetical protein